MAKDKKNDPAAAGEEGGEKKGGNPFLVIGIIVGIIIIQTVLAYLVVTKLKPEDDDVKAAKAAEDSLRLASEAATRMGAVTSDAPIEATVNIAGTDGERYLKAAIIIEYDEKNIRLGNELRQRTPRYRDMFINHLSTLTLMEVTEPGARDKIRADLVRMINNNLPSGIGEIHDVLFTTYIIQ